MNGWISGGPRRVVVVSAICDNVGDLFLPSSQLALTGLSIICGCDLFSVGGFEEIVVDLKPATMAA